MDSNSFSELKHMLEKQQRSGLGGNECPGVAPNYC